MWHANASKNWFCVLNWCMFVSDHVSPIYFICQFSQTEVGPWFCISVSRRRCWWGWGRPRWWCCWPPRPPHPPRPPGTRWSSPPWPPPAPGPLWCPPLPGNCALASSPDSREVLSRHFNYKENDCGAFLRRLIQYHAPGRGAAAYRWRCWCYRSWEPPHTDCRWWGGWSVRYYYRVDT